VSDDDIGRYENTATLDRAYEASLRQLSYRRRSAFELQTYLNSHDYDLEGIKTTIERLQSMGLIDDEAFARAWVADRQLLRPRSKRALAAELAKKGIDRDVAQIALADSSQDDEIQSLVAIIERKRRLSQYNDTQKLIGYLARQGYQYGQIKEALARFD
jgi:regulatory protein